MLNSNTKSFRRVNRSELIADTNLKKDGSLNVSVLNPTQINDDFYLLSRVGRLDIGTGKTPIPGYCLHFDSTNTSAFIQTSIPSSSRVNYNITIKGEGTIDVLYIDSSGTYIAIKQKQALTNGDYFDLSYIAFTNRNSGKIEHLFECEEGNGLYLYDAITGESAFLTTDGTNMGVTSLSSLRASSSNKEWIKNENKNLENEISFDGGYAIASNGIVNSFPFSFCCTFKLLDNLQTDYYTLLFTNAQAWTQGIGCSIAKHSSGGIIITILYADVNHTTINSYRAFSTVLPVIGETYKLVVCVSGLNSGHLPAIVKLNGISATIISDQSNASITSEFTPAAARINMGNLQNASIASNKKIIIKDFKIFNFDISANDAPYTIQDYQNGKDVPSNLLGACDVSNPATVSSITPYADNTIGNNSTITVSGNDYIFAPPKAATTGYRWQLKNNIVFKKNALVEFTCDSNDSNSRIQLSAIRVVSPQGNSQPTHTVSGTSLKFNAESDFNIVEFRFWRSAGSADDDTITISNPKIKINGLLLNLNNAITTPLLTSYLGSSTFIIGTDLTIPANINGAWVNSTEDLPEGATIKAIFGSSGALGTFTPRTYSCAYVPSTFIDLSSYANKNVSISIKCKLKRNYDPSASGLNSSQGFMIRFAETSLVNLDRLSISTELPEKNVWYDKEWSYLGPIKLSSYYGNNVYIVGCIYDTVTHTDAYEIANLEIKVNNIALPSTILDSSLNNNNMTLFGAIESPNKEYGTWCNAVGATFDRLVLWDKDYSANNLTSTGIYGCWTVNIGAWSITGTSQDHFNNSLVGNALRITAKADNTGYWFYFWLNTYANTDAAKNFCFRCKKLYINFDSILVHVNNSDSNQAYLSTRIVYYKKDGTRAQTDMVGESKSRVVDTTTLEDFDYISGIYFSPGCYNLPPVGVKNFVAGDYYEFENFSVIAEDAEILNNVYSSGYNPQPVNIPRKVLT